MALSDWSIDDREPLGQRKSRSRPEAGAPLRAVTSPRASRARAGSRPEACAQPEGHLEVNRWRKAAGQVRACTPNERPALLRLGATIRGRVDGRAGRTATSDAAAGGDLLVRPRANRKQLMLFSRAACCAGWIRSVDSQRSPTATHSWGTRQGAMSPPNEGQSSDYGRMRSVLCRASEPPVTTAPRRSYKGLRAGQRWSQSGSQLRFLFGQQRGHHAESRYRTRLRSYRTHCA